MGLVYEATHARLAGRYAIKVLPAKWSKDPEAMARFDREARITSSLQHPNIVQIIDFNTAADGTEYLVMEYLRGETLAARLARVGCLPLDTVAAIIEQVASGLAAAHGHGIVHRDLKPDNVFLMQVEGREGEWAKILDFGISKMSDASLGTIDPVNKTLIGTPQYMAPEQCEGRNTEVGAAADQFALAAMTYEMLTGRRPFSGETLGEVLFRVLHAEPPPMNVDAGVEAVVRRGLAKSSRRRYPSVTAFAEALRAAALARAQSTTGDRLEVSGSHGYAVGELERTRWERPPRRRRRATTLAAALVVTIAAAFVVRTARTNQPSPPVPRAAARLASAVVVPTAAGGASSPPAPPPVPQLERLAEASLPSAADRGAPDSTYRREDDASAAAMPARPADAATRPRVPRTPPARALAAARVPSMRSTGAMTGAMTARPSRTADLAAARSNVPVSAPQPPPFIPARAVDDDAILPLDENFSDRN